MHNTKQKKCKGCGKVTDTLYSDWYCYDCYAVIWNNGFETSSQWGESVAHHDAMADIDDDCSDDIEGMKDSIGYVLSNFELGEWACKQCGYIRLTIEEQEAKNQSNIVAILIQPCPDCGGVGFLKHGLIH